MAFLCGWVVVDFYTNLQSTANKLLAGRGQSMTVTKTVINTYDPVSKAYLAPNDSEMTCYGAIFPVGAGKGYLLDSVIETSDATGYIAAQNADGTSLDFTPNAGQKLTEAGGDWHINAVAEIAPAGTAVLYICGLKR